MKLKAAIEHFNECCELVRGAKQQCRDASQQVIDIVLNACEPEPTSPDGDFGEELVVICENYIVTLRQTPALSGWAMDLDQVQVID